MFPLQSQIMPKSGRPNSAAIMLQGLIVLLVSIFATTTNAATCSQLKHQLASIGKSQSGSNKYKRAAARQLKQLNILKRAIRRARCSAPTGLKQRQNLNCGVLKDTQNRMEARLYALREKAGGGNHTSNRKRRRIKLLMRQKECGSRSVTVLPKRKKKQSLVKAIYGNIDHDRTNNSATTRKNKRSKSNRRRSVSLSRFFSKGTPVTAVCVRTCDGYHFPVNFSGRRGNFENASDICRTMCPGAEMALYLRRSSTKSTNHLYSAATGEPYAALPKSFAFQKNFNPNCSCNYNLLNQASTGETANKTKQEALAEQNVSEIKTTIPVPRIDRGQDPETMQNLAGGWSLKMAQDLKTPHAKKVVSNKEAKKIRIVGDTYFPGQ